MIIDEVHTPDSSRFWLAESYEGLVAQDEEPENFDKEFLRLWYADHGYRGDGEPPEPTDDLIAQVSERYIALYEMLTGQTFSPGTYPANPRIARTLQEFL
jgi:phosphoribosylaminoimidazole-succinocarboxamide synthase